MTIITQSTTPKTPNHLIGVKNTTRAQIIIDDIRDLIALNKTEDMAYLLDELPWLIAAMKEAK
ncbi:MAG: hypothetical protein KOO63_08335 [Bacteroidales bacterium]|nr:hypothetical protein [Candidatus Latescibacterota bacterium]